MENRRLHSKLTGNEAEDKETFQFLMLIYGNVYILSNTTGAYFYI